MSEADEFASLVQDLVVEEISFADLDVTLENLPGSHSMTEVGASAAGGGIACCSCCIVCCCCT